MKKLPKYNIELTLENLLIIDGVMGNTPDDKEFKEIRKKIRKKIFNILEEDPSQTEVLRKVFKKFAIKMSRLM